MEEKILTIRLVKELGLDKIPVITADMLAGYTSIGESAFNGCRSLISIEIPNSVISIRGFAFYECNSLTSVTIGNGVTIIGEAAFESCSSLTSVTIGNSVISIGHLAFSNCVSLTSLTIPDSVKEIGDLAFSWCSRLISVTIKNKTFEKQTIETGKCKAYKAFNADMTCKDFQYKEGETYEIKERPVLCIRGFHACLNLTDVFGYYYGKFGENIVIHEVELEGVSGERVDDSKVVAKKITIGKRIL